MVDAIVVGAGPNGLAAAVTLARAGLAVTVYERNATIGGGARTAELTLPGFLHDICSAVHPMALASEFFREFELEKRISLLRPSVSYGHPLDGGRAGIAYPSLADTVSGLGRDGAAYGRLMGALVARADDVAGFTGSNLVGWPRHPLVAALFGLRSLEQGSPLWNLRFHDEIAPAMLSGVAAHAIQTMPSLATAGAALSLGTYAHARGWPVPAGGSQAIVDALATDLIAHGGTIETDAAVLRLADLPESSVVMCDTTPRALASLTDLPDRYARRISRFRYGNAASKVDFALSGPVPWTNPELHNAGTLHLGGTRAEIAAAERSVKKGQHSDSPYVLVAQPSVVDDSRAPAGQHALWAYSHVPRDSAVDQTEVITQQIERFAPGFRDLILASASKTAVELEQYNPNYIGGDIAAGAATLKQLAVRPVLSSDPWRTPVKGVYLCSSSTPPGPGVHGLAGWLAAKSALRNEFDLGAPDLSLG
jgi:phytoene dehydrogenase-like protein